MDDSDDNDLDNLVDRRVDDDDLDERLALQDRSEQGEHDDGKRIVPVKVRTKNPQPKLNTER